MILRNDSGEPVTPIKQLDEIRIGLRKEEYDYLNIKNICNNFDIVEELTNKLIERENILSILAKNYYTVVNAFEIYEDVRNKFKNIKKMGFDNHEYPKFKIYHSIRKLKAHIIETKFCGDDKYSFLNKLCNDNENNWEWELNDTKWVTLKGWGFDIYTKDDYNNRIKFIFKKQCLQGLVYKYKGDVKKINLPEKYWDKEFFLELMSGGDDLYSVFKEIIISKFSTSSKS